MKAVIAKQTRKYDFPDKKSAMDYHIHDLAKLVGLAGLNQDLQKNLVSNKIFAINWNIIKDWSENSRYRKSNKISAKDIIDAISDPKDGVLIWIEQFW